jgi:hypothetical protein
MQSAGSRTHLQAISCAFEPCEGLLLRPTMSLDIYIFMRFVSHITPSSWKPLL